MSLVHEIFADEAWTHCSAPLRRYWCFYGGIFGPESDLYRLDRKLRAVQAGRKTIGEIKWSSLTPANLNVYTAFADCLFDEIASGSIKYRQMFCDRSLVRVAPYGEPPVSDLDVQFKLCYQFIKHSFGIEYLDRGSEHEVRVHLDGHSSQKHKKRLALFSRDIPKILNHDRLKLSVSYHQSDKASRIQACDLIIGAAGSKGNRMDQLREPGQRGMTAKQKARADLSQHIYDRLRAIDAADRGSAVFHWFESTGKDGDRTNLLNHKVRIWKFKPKMYRVDEGWQNKNLDKFGQYRGPEINPTVHDVDTADRFVY
jgi:hypothetical protein